MAHFDTDAGGMVIHRFPLKKETNRNMCGESGRKAKENDLHRGSRSTFERGTNKGSVREPVAARLCSAVLGVHRRPRETQEPKELRRAFCAQIVLHSADRISIISDVVSVAHRAPTEEIHPQLGHAAWLERQYTERATYEDEVVTAGGATLLPVRARDATAATSLLQFVA